MSCCWGWGRGDRLKKVELFLSRVDLIDGTQTDAQTIFELFHLVRTPLLHPCNILRLIAAEEKGRNLQI